MKELQFLDVINKTLSDTSLLGDDCAYLKDFDQYVTQDTLCEGVHFDLKYTDFESLAQKAVEVNISDLAANLAEPKYISISLSVPKSFDNNFIKQFYKGVEKCCEKYKIKVCGGDITGSKSGLVISICAVGKSIYCAPKVSRSYAKENQYVCVTKNYGSSAYALHCLKNRYKCSDKIIESHLVPKADMEVSKALGKLKCNQIAVMDSSDGLCDALYKISKASDKSIDIKFEDIPYDREIENYGKNYKDLIFWGGEDYGLVFCLDKNDFEQLKNNNPQIDLYKIGIVKPKNKNYFVKIDDMIIDDKIFEQKSFNHFEGDN